jgi:hypothetical protein
MIKQLMDHRSRPRKQIIPYIERAVTLHFSSPSQSVSNSTSNIINNQIISPDRVPALPGALMCRRGEEKSSTMPVRRPLSRDKNMRLVDVCLY